MRKEMLIVAIIVLLTLGLTLIVRHFKPPASMEIQPWGIPK